MFFLMFCLTIVAVFALFAFVGNPFWIRLLHDNRGVLGTGTFLQERTDQNCGLPRPPGPRYPAYSETFGGVFDANGNASHDLHAERDLLLSGLSIDSESEAGSVRVSATYCGVLVLDHVSMRTFPVCCDRKPIFLVGVKEGKDLRFTLSGGTAADDWSISVHGIQGNGCCP